MSFLFTMEAPDGQGTVTPAVGSASYPSGSVVNLTAVPAYGWAFDHWTINGALASGESVSHVTMSANKSLKAYFKISESFLVTYTSTPCVVPSTFNGMLLQPGEDTTYPSGTFITINAPGRVGTITMLLRPEVDNPTEYIAPYGSVKIEVVE